MTGQSALDQRMAQEGKLLKLYVLSLTRTAVDLFGDSGWVQRNQGGKDSNHKDLEILTQNGHHHL